MDWVPEELSIHGTAQWGHSSNNQCQLTCHMYRNGVCFWAAFGIDLERMRIDIEGVRADEVKLACAGPSSS